MRNVWGKDVWQYVGGQERFIVYRVFSIIVNGPHLVDRRVGYVPGGHRQSMRGTIG